MRPALKVEERAGRLREGTGRLLIAAANGGKVNSMTRRLACHALTISAGSPLGSRDEFVVIVGRQMEAAMLPVAFMPGFLGGLDLLLG